MKVALVIVVTAATAILSGAVGYVGGVFASYSAIVSGGQYVTGLKDLPEENEQSHSYNSASSDKRLFCRAVQEATGVLPMGCEDLFPTETHGEPE